MRPNAKKAAGGAPAAGVSVSAGGRYSGVTRGRRGSGLCAVATRIVGNDHRTAGIAQTYEARAISAEPRFRLFVEKVRIGGGLSPGLPAS
jgi:hypothetical protein